MANNNVVHRSYRISQQDQYAFEALCHVRGSIPSQVVVDLINRLVAEHISNDPPLSDTLAAIVKRRIDNVSSLISGTEAAPE
jgi:hypothetical protein